MTSVVASFNSHLRKANFSDFFSCWWLPCRFTRIFGSHPSVTNSPVKGSSIIALTNLPSKLSTTEKQWEFTSKIAWYCFWLYFGVLGMIHGKLQIFFQMFSQISRTPNFERSFRVKRCGLYAGVYGMWLFVQWNVSHSALPWISTPPPRPFGRNFKKCLGAYSKKYSKWDAQF